MDALPDLRGLHVAVIEDNADTRELLATVLQHCGAIVTAYDSAKSALGDVAEFLPSAFICDLAMPDMDGVEFIRRLRALGDDKGRDVPALAITGFYEQFAAPLARAAGFNAYLTKPLQVNVVCRVVRDLVLPPPAPVQRLA